MTPMPPTSERPLRIALWSGPRNISTAMMRSWENRRDATVVDEPFYAYYLKATGFDHPGAAEVIAAQDTDWRKVVASLVGPVPGNLPIWYQKQMTHHLLPEVDRSWLSNLANGFLIRDPKEMLTSLVKVLPEPRLEDTGMPQQAELFELVRDQTGQIPPVIDAKDVLENPRRMLGLLCESWGVPFDEAMLSWPPGSRPTDGIWAKHWYDNVEKSSTFHPYTPKNEPVPAHLLGVLKECDSLYAQMYHHRIQP